MPEQDPKTVDPLDAAVQHLMNASRWVGIGLDKPPRMTAQEATRNRLDLQILFEEIQDVENRLRTVMSRQRTGTAVEWNVYLRRGTST